MRVANPAMNLLCLCISIALVDIETPVAPHAGLHVCSVLQSGRVFKKASG